MGLSSSTALTTPVIEGGFAVAATANFSTMNATVDRKAMSLLSSLEFLL
jgi:hypothetical protein